MAERHPIAAGLSALEDILKRERDVRGTQFVALLPESRERLRALPRRLAEAASEPSPSIASAGEPSPPSEVASDASTPAPAPSSSPPPAPAQAVAEPGEPAGERTEQWAREQLNGIFRQVKSSDLCRTMGTLRETVVFATGNPLADLMFVGEAPGAEEEKQREPFVGPAGQKLTQIIGAMGLQRGDVYISNIVKFRPKEGDGRFQGSRNRKPTGTEMEACIPFIRAEIDVVRPRAIVALGRTAAEGLLDTGDPIGRLRDQEHEFQGVPVIVTYHPSYILRQEGEGGDAAKDAKRRVWEDMLRAMEVMGLPISDRQRNFFR